MVSERGYEWAFLHFRCVRDVVAGKRVTRWSTLGTYRKFAALTGLRLNELEPYVVALRVSNVGTSRVITKPKLPFRLATPAGARMIGYRGDATYGTSSFRNKDPQLHEDYKRAITEVVGENPFTTPREDGVDRTNVGVFVTRLVSVAGLDTTQRQKNARNPFPSWFFVANDDVVVDGIRALCEAEGNEAPRGIRVSQAIGFDELDFGDFCPTWPSKPAVSKLPKTTREEILKHPPPLLSSTALLLYGYRIVSHLMLERLSKTQTGFSVYWTLSVYRGDNKRAFGSIIQF